MVLTLSATWTCLTQPGALHLIEALVAWQPLAATEDGPVWFARVGGDRSVCVVTDPLVIVEMDLDWADAGGFFVMAWDCSRSTV